MKIGKRKISFLLVIALVFLSSFSTCFASIKDYEGFNAYEEYEKRAEREVFRNGTYLPENIFSSEENAEILFHAGLFNGTNNGFELERPANRTEALVMFLRLLGKESTAKELKYDCPFYDVPTWAKDYVGYAYSTGLTKGVSSTLFEAEKYINAQQYATFILRALGYIENKDFTYEDSLSFLNSIKGTNYKKEPKSFVRGDMVNMSMNALMLIHQPSKNPLVEYLGVGFVSEWISERTEWGNNPAQYWDFPKDRFYNENKSKRVIIKSGSDITLNPEYGEAGLKDIKALYKNILNYSPFYTFEDCVKDNKICIHEIFYTEGIKEDDAFIFVGEGEDVKYVGIVPCAQDRCYNTNIGERTVLDVLYLEVVR